MNRSIADDTPIIVNEEIANFFAIADVGRYITGNFKLQYDRPVVAIETTQASDKPLNSALFFTMPTINGLPNPLYRIATRQILLELFYIHSDYSQMEYPENNFFQSASPAMRQYLRQTLIKTIRTDGDKILQDYPNMINQVNDAVNSCIAGIDDPNLNRGVEVEFKLGVAINPTYYLVFNPNYFAVPEFRKIVDASIDSLASVPNSPEFQQIYRTIFTQETTLTPEVVLKFEDQAVELARGFLNSPQGRIAS